MLIVAEVTLVKRHDCGSDEVKPQAGITKF
jgi:hypothetical protein